MTLVALVLLLVLGIVAIFIGKQFLERQSSIMSKVAAQQKQHIQQHVATHHEMGLLLYYLRFSLISPPDPLSALSIGQRDVNPGVQSITIRGLQGQTYDTDLTNPVQLHSGNLDLGFVILYLFPLVIMAFTFNLLSEEKESGTWRLVAVQSRSLLYFLWCKLSVRALFIYVLLVLLLGIAVLMVPLPLSATFWAFVLVSVLYVMFWLVLAFWVSSLKRSSGFNVLTLLSVWVMLTFLLPAMVNNVVSAYYPLPEALSTIVKQRDGYHEKWDMEKSVTMAKFYEHYPQFSSYGIPQENFSWLWYYAMQQMGDDAATPERDALRKKIQQRERASQRLAWAIPTLHAQLQMNDLARTSLTDYIRLLDAAQDFHEKNRLYFYPRIFDQALVHDVDWSQITPAYVPLRAGVNWLLLALPLMAINLLLLLVVWLRRKRLKSVD